MMTTRLLISQSDLAFQRRLPNPAHGLERHMRRIIAAGEPAAIAGREPAATLVFGTLPPGGGANLTTLTHLGGGSDPPSKKFNTLWGGGLTPLAV